MCSCLYCVVDCQGIHGNHISLHRFAFHSQIQGSLGRWVAPVLVAFSSIWYSVSCLKLYIYSVDHIASILQKSTIDYLGILCFIESVFSREKSHFEMNHVIKILDTWSGVTNQLRMRDRSVKVLQYGCQMLLGFYAGKMRQDVFDMLALFRRTASTSRKAFWLLKSFNHITSSIHLVQKIMLGDFSSLILADLLEQILLACYFLCENIVFFIRVKALPWNENEVEPWTSWYWFLSDFAGLIAALIRFYNSWYSCYFNGLSLSLDCKQQLLKYRRMYFDFSTLIIVSFCIYIFEFMLLNLTVGFFLLVYFGGYGIQRFCSNSSTPLGPSQFWRWLSWLVWSVVILDDFRRRRSQNVDRTVRAREIKLFSFFPF